MELGVSDAIILHYDNLYTVQPIVTSEVADYVFILFL